MSKRTRVSNPDDLRTEYEDDFPTFEGPCPHCGELVGSSDEADAPKPRIFHFAPDRSWDATTSRPACPHCEGLITRTTPAGAFRLEEGMPFRGASERQQARGSRWNEAGDPTEKPPHPYRFDSPFVLVRRF